MARELSPAATLGAYAAGLALVFAAALGVGRAVGPVGATADSGGSTMHGTGHDVTGHDDGMSGEAR